MLINILKIIDVPVKRKIVLYKPDNQNIGIAKHIEVNTAKIVISLILINCSSLKKNASQVQIIHKLKSIIMAIIFFAKRGKRIIWFDVSVKIFIDINNYLLNIKRQMI